MYAFNALQFVALYAFLPWAIVWLKERDLGLPGFGCLILFLAMSVFLIFSTTNSLYTIDKEIRG
jgi:hypothetical protein